MISIYGVSIVLLFLKLLSGNRNLRHNYMGDFCAMILLCQVTFKLRDVKAGLFINSNCISSHYNIVIYDTKCRMRLLIMAYEKESYSLLTSEV